MSFQLAKILFGQDKLRNIREIWTSPYIRFQTQVQMDPNGMVSISVTLLFYDLFAFGFPKHRPIICIKLDPEM